MYTFSYFQTDQQDSILRFMHNNSFITLIGYDGEFPVATQVPVKIAIEGDEIKLTGHIMVKTDHYEAFEKNPKTLAVFTGPHTYVSASVYETPAAASTWNYMAVQAKGDIRLLTAEETYDVVKDLTNHYENPETSPAAFHKMDDAYIQKLLKAIRGFEIVVTHLDHVFKLSQNHNSKNKAAIIENLEKGNDVMGHQIASEMKKI
ncbi:MAG TPA: FMN-binding negative transcriptional regulator [Pedobacter sp.]|nr:FMN-binding negative transcriptional regulator [Pedobacter sp.]